METRTGKFRHGLKIGEVVYIGFEMREATVQDMTEAEIAAARTGGGVHTPIAFNGHMMAQQLTGVSTPDGEIFKGPFTFTMLARLKPADYRELRAVQQELDQLGEPE